MRPRTANLVGGLGRAMVGVGVLLLAFAAFQLWGTALAAQRAQDALGDDFERRRAAVVVPATVPDDSRSGEAGEPATRTRQATGAAAGEPATGTGQGTGAAVPEPSALAPRLGETIGRITIPAIGVDKYVVHGVRRDDLRRGPGHFPGSPLPGQPGNAAIAGHRTTYGAPFEHLDRLRPGDAIVVETLQGTFRYEVMGHPDGAGGTIGHQIVDPYEGVAVLDDFGDDRLTLTACHPKFSARQRIVVTALLTSPPAPGTPPAAGPVGGGDPLDQADTGPAGGGDPLDQADTGPAGGSGDPLDQPAAGDQDGVSGDPLDQPAAGDQDGVASPDPSAPALEGALGWDTSALAPAAGWGAVTAALALGVAAAGRRWRRWPAWALGTPAVAAALFVTFGHLDRLLPAM
jgi:sortase A